MKRVALVIALLWLLVTIKFYSLEDDNTIVLGFGGDVMLGRLTDRTIANRGYMYPWGNIIEELAKTDLNIINLENTFTRSNKKVLKLFCFKSQPENVQVLVDGNIHIANLANNHIMDYSQEGLVDTLNNLDKFGIKYVGAGINIDHASKPVIIEKHGISIGVIGYSDNEPSWLASETEPGINYVKVGDIKKIKNHIRLLRKKVDVLILSIHWGPNMRLRPTQEFIDFAHAIVDAGVDIIHGHSAHIVQGIEVYKKKLIMYDTGDFIDDYAIDPKLRNDLGFLFKVKVGKKGLRSLSLLPTIISDMQVNKADGVDKQFILQRTRDLSLELGTKFDNEMKIVF